MAKTKAWKGKLELLLPDIEAVYRSHGSPVIKEGEHEESIVRMALEIKDRRDVAAVILGAIADGRAPDPEIVLGASFESIFFGGVMRKVASVIERQLDPGTGDRKLIAGRDDEGRQIWALTESELGDRFYEERAAHSLGTTINAAYAHEINGHGGAFEFFERLVDQARQGLEHKLESEKETV